MPRTDRVAYVFRWLDRARVDLGSAHTLLRDRGATAAWVGCFHSQQAIEKYQKAVIAATGSEPPYTHNLVALRALLPSQFPFPAAVDLGLVTTYATSSRYVLAAMPEEPDPTWEDARAAFGWAESIGQATEEWLMD